MVSELLAPGLDSGVWISCCHSLTGSCTLLYRQTKQAVPALDVAVSPADQLIPVGTIASCFDGMLVVKVGRLCTPAACVAACNPKTLVIHTV